MIIYNNNSWVFSQNYAINSPVIDSVLFLMKQLITSYEAIFRQWNNAIKGRLGLFDGTQPMKPIRLFQNTLNFVFNLNFYASFDLTGTYKNEKHEWKRRYHWRICDRVPKRLPLVYTYITWNRRSIAIAISGGPKIHVIITWIILSPNTTVIERDNIINPMW